MRIASCVSPLAIRAAAVMLVSIGSLNLALEAAQLVFLTRQGQRAPGIPAPALAWLAVLAAGLTLYARRERISDQVRTLIEQRWGAI